ncbi:MAG: phenylalanine--tRNA ligase subunit alpha [Spirochaeta sp. LUC14_002_19_P3]|nr:MAG: phenylalanine--tRNA ligase subunit alpha [Spirochaeta sp. LUC14_002_19_P3]
MLEKLKNLEESFRQALKNIDSEAKLADLKARFLGKKGELSAILKTLSNASMEERKKLGQAANELKDRLTARLEEAKLILDRKITDAKLAADWTDITLRRSLMAESVKESGQHPLSIVQRELEDIFLSMGFDILDGPHIETDWYNFTALNIPESHPARDMQDTFWFKDMKHLLRTHTSTIQIRGMEHKTPPFRFVAPGKVFRCETTDASHEAVFHQMEGMLVGKDISVAHLIYFEKTLLSEIFQREVEIRLRPGFFPFVEPGFELDINCLICSGKGCSVCKQTGWVELLPCGMTHPNVLRYGGIDPEEYTGFAFGLGLDRLVMMRYGIDDIRLIHSGNLDFSRQFASC